MIIDYALFRKSSNIMGLVKIFKLKPANSFSYYYNNENKGWFLIKLIGNCKLEDYCFKKYTPDIWVSYKA